MKKALAYLGFIMVVMIMMAAVFTYVTPHFGWRVDAVLTDSMEPRLKVGSLVVTVPVEPDTIKIGDIITFRPTAGGRTMITHRVIGIEQNSPLRFETMGDANIKPDPDTVPQQNVAGKVYFNVPSVGFLTEFLKTPLGFVFGMVIPGIVLITLYVASMWRALSARDIKQGQNEVV